MKNIVIAFALILSAAVAKAERYLECERQGKVIRVDSQSGQVSLLAVGNSARLSEVDSDEIVGDVMTAGGYVGNVFVATYSVTMKDGQLDAKIGNDGQSSALYLGKFSEALIGYANSPVAMENCSLY